jgi:hypothetical protein
LSQNHNNQTSFLFNHYDGKFHFVNLDSEIKVINNLINDHRDSLRVETNIINTKCGRGSNWASGYAGLKKDGALKIIEKSIDSIRSEMERCDFLLNFNIQHSLSGGTGSGCGSRLIERLRDEFGYKKYIFTQSVAPFRDGELPLQHYNNLLCLSHLNEFADCITLFHNDDVFNQIEKQYNEYMNSNPSSVTSNTKTKLMPTALKKTLNNNANINTNDNTISIKQMNSYIIRSFLDMIYPVDNVSLKSQSIGMEYYELQRLLCPNPNLKIIELYDVNVSPSSFSSVSRYSNVNNNKIQLVKQLLSLVPRYKKEFTDNHYVSLNSLIIARGTHDLNNDNYSTKQIMSQIWQDYDLIKKHLNPVEWNPFTIDFWSSKSSINDPYINTTTNTKAKSNSLTIATNRNRCVDYLKQVEEKSLEKYKARAYLHWYNKFNINDDHFENSFENIRNIIDNYNYMTAK